MKTVKSLFLVLFFSVIAINWAQSQATKPYQFIAKMYTEAFGRAPDPSGWNVYQEQMYSTQNLTVWMRDLGISFYNNNPEFTSKYPQPTYNAARLLALYRGALNREPDQPGFNSYLSLMNSGTTWSTIVNLLFNSGEFNTLATNAINRANIGKPNYGWGNTPILNLITNYPSSGFSGTGSQLQEQLDITPNGQTLFLAQMAVISLTSPLRIPAGVTIRTTGNPTPLEYAKMARIIWDNSTPANNMIILNSGSCIENVWIDGGVGEAFPRIQYNQLITSVRFNDNTAVQNNRIVNNRFSDPPGWTNIFLRGESEGCDCNNINVNQNLITGYATDHFTRRADGISVTCESTTINSNQIVDMTDVGIVIFKSALSGINHQQSKIKWNYILNAGNSAIGAIALDPGSSTNTTAFDYSNTEVWYNTVWTSYSAHFDAVFWLGTRSMFRTSPARGQGGSVRYNSSGINNVNTNAAFVLDGMLDVQVNETNDISVNTFDSYFSIPTGQRISNSNSLWASTASGSDVFMSYNSDPFLDNIGHSGGVYISGPNSCSSRWFESFSAINLGEQTVPQFHWLLYGGNSQLTSYELLAEYYDQNIEVDFNHFNYYERIWLRLENNFPFPENGWNNKYITMTLSKKSLNSSASTLPLEYDLYQNFPNPFNPTTTINYALKEKGLVKLNVYDMLGQEVAVLVNKHQDAGQHSVNFDASNRPSGVYIYKLQTNGFSDSKKLLLVK